MQKWLENKFTNCLNYEHTIFLNEAVIEFLLAKNHFKLLEKRYFKEHSIFYACQKLTNFNENYELGLKSQYTQNKALVAEFMSFYSQKIAKLNELLKATKKPIYLFGAHLFSQFLLYNGLFADKIIAILDNNAQKQNKRLYGTAFKVLSPRILRDKNALLVLNAGVYNEEIKKDILENINEKTQIVEF